MIRQKISTGNHQWNKKNLLTIVTNKDVYDIMECKCGLKGKSRALGTIDIDGRQKKKAAKCTFYKPEDSVKNIKVRITQCTATGHIFSNITPKSEHLLITPPEDRDKSETWVMGNGEPVRLLEGEFVIIKD